MNVKTKTIFNCKHSRIKIQKHMKNKSSIYFFVKKVVHLNETIINKISWIEFKTLKILFRFEIHILSTQLMNKTI